jgi:uncharacterized protein (TIGR00297 family)
MIHLGAGFLAFGLRWVGPLPLLAVAGVGVLFNSWVLPRVGGRWLWRQQEIESDRAVGVVMYPFTVSILLLLYYRRPEVAAAGWGLLAFGDGTAALAGQWWGRHRLPWNRSKSWAGFVGYLLVGWMAVATLVSWTMPGRYEVSFLWMVSGAVALLGAFLESAPQRIDDNLAVPLVTSLWLLCLLWTEGRWATTLEPSFVSGLLVGLVINGILAVAGYLLATLDLAGAMVGCLLGAIIFGFLGGSGYLVLLVFFLLGSLTTRLGYEQKANLQLAETRGGRRSAANALANGGVATACALFAGMTPHEQVFTWAFVGSLAAAAADTVESELGQLWGRPTLLLTTLRPVEPGTNGGVSPLGTVAGLAASAVAVAVAWVTGLLPAAAIVPLALVALLATVLESFAGATLERSGLLDNNGVNFLNTMLGALLGAGLAVVML